jgi:hypothetical protein
MKMKMKMQKSHIFSVLLIIFFSNQSIFADPPTPKQLAVQAHNEMAAARTTCGEEIEQVNQDRAECLSAWQAAEMMGGTCEQCQQNWDTATTAKQSADILIGAAHIWWVMGEDSRADGDEAWNLEIWNIAETHYNHAKTDFTKAGPLLIVADALLLGATHLFNEMQNCLCWEGEEA